MKVKIKYSDWQPWLERPFSPLTLSLFKNSVHGSYYQKIGVSKKNYPMLFQNNFWYQSPSMMSDLAKDLGKYLKNHSFFDFSSGFDKLYRTHKKEVIKLTTSQDPIQYKLERLADIFSCTTAYIMLTHGFEKYYSRYPQWLLDFIRPRKKVASQKMELALKRGDDLKEIQQKYGWLRCRDKFARPFSLAELKQERRTLLAEKIKLEKPKLIPNKYKKVSQEIAELIWFRTHRTDVFYELWYLSRPILKQAASYYKIPFAQLPYYNLFDLVSGHPHRYPKKFAVYIYQDRYLTQARPFVKIKKINHQVITGQIAFPGKVSGRVKIVKSTTDLKKVKPGDILVAQMTFPSFVLAMRKAAAFVTDEGGITCHAAIVAREMRKPCLIGTKIATQLLKDNMKITVDANSGKII